MLSLDEMCSSLRAGRDPVEGDQDLKCVSMFSKQSGV